MINSPTFRLLKGLLILLMLIPTQSPAQQNQLEVQLKSRPFETLSITRKLAADQKSVSSNFILQARPGKMPRLESAILIEANSGQVLKDISIDTTGWSKAVEKNALNIKVDNIEAVGRYTGDVLFERVVNSGRGSGEVKKDTLLLGFRLDLQILPVNVISIETGENAIDLSLVNNEWWFNKRLWQDKSFGVKLNNRSEYPVDMSYRFMVRAKNKIAFDPNFIISPQDTPLIAQPGKLNLIPFDIDAKGVKAGSYTGVLELDDKTALTPPTLVMNISVKNGIFWVLVALLLGFLFGYLARTHDEWKDRIEVFREINELEKRIRESKLSDAEKKTYLDQLAGLKEELPYAQDANELNELKTRLEKINTDFEEQIPIIVAKSVSPPQTDRSDEARPSISSAPAKWLKHYWFAFSKWLYRVLLGQPSLKVLLYVYRPWLYLISILITFILTIREIYLKDPTFGNDGFYDYFKVFLIGAGITIAANSLFMPQVNTWMNKLGK